MSETSINFGVEGRAGRAGGASNDKILTGKGLEPALPPASPADQPPKVGQEVGHPIFETRPHHKEFEVGHRVVVTVEGLHNGAKGEITGKRYLGRTHIRYDIKLDKPSHSLTEIFVEVPVEAKRTYLIDANVPPRS
jgi:hypothetical protein